MRRTADESSVAGFVDLGVVEYGGDAMLLDGIKRRIAAAEQDAHQIDCRITN